MAIQTHKRIDPELCGKPVHLEEGNEFRDVVDYVE